MVLTIVFFSIVKHGSISNIQYTVKIKKNKLNSAECVYVIIFAICVGPYVTLYQRNYILLKLLKYTVVSKELVPKGLRFRTLYSVDGQQCVMMRFVFCINGVSSKEYIYIYIYMILSCERWVAYVCAENSHFDISKW